MVRYSSRGEGGGESLLHVGGGEASAGCGGSVAVGGGALVMTVVLW